MVLAFVDVMSPASAGDENKPECYEIVNLYSVAVQCEYDGDSLDKAQEETPDADWRIYQLCKDGTSGGREACSNPRVCRVGEKIGTLYVVFRNDERMGVACLTAGEATSTVVDVRRLAIEAFKKVEWPASDLVIQPPGGETLVNLDTIFYTTNSEPIPQTLTLAGRSVTIEATPTTYTWHFGDNSSTSTSSPGHPYPDQDVVHVYEQTGDALASVDTTYTGRFRIGDGRWQSIPATRTIAGSEVELTVLEAKPQLVIR
jgi:hypothetical protein